MSYIPSELVENKYFQIGHHYFRCANRFNHCRMDENGLIFLYERKPVCRIEKGYWSGQAYSRDIPVPYKGPKIKGDWTKLIFEVK